MHSTSFALLPPFLFLHILWRNFLQPCAHVLIITALWTVVFMAKTAGSDADTPEIPHVLDDLTVRHLKALKDTGTEDQAYLEYMGFCF